MIKPDNENIITNKKCRTEIKIQNSEIRNHNPEFRNQNHKFVMKLIITNDYYRTEIFTIFN